jgi:anaerobic selenocysteine-containing dehydrogenase
MLRKKVVELWECWPDWKIVFELAKKMGYKEYFPWNDVEEALDFMLKPSGITVRQLKEKPSGFAYAQRRYKRYEESGFNTPSKKIELYCERLERYGYDPLPAHIEPAMDPQISGEYPLILTSGGRILEFVHGQHRNIPKLRKRVPEPWIEIHPSTAGKYGIREGDLVIVESAKGAIEVKARVTDAIPPKLVHVSHGWSEANVNLLTDDEARDPVSGFPAFKYVPCRVSKKI